jgi:MYXO-CTERM domain-containing protein
LGEGWLVVWQESGGLKGAVLDPLGEPKASPFVIAEDLQEFYALGGGSTGALVAFRRNFVSVLVHVTLDGAIDNTAEIERPQSLTLAPSSTGWLAAFAKDDWAGVAVTARRVATSGELLDETVISESSNGSVVSVPTEDGYKVYWTTSSGELWARRVLADGTWLCDGPTLVASGQGAIYGLRGIAAGSAAWFSWTEQPFSDWSKILTLPALESGNSSDKIVQWVPVNSAALALADAQPVYPSARRWYLAAAEAGQVPTRLKQAPATDARLSPAIGNQLLLASAVSVRLFSSPTNRIQTNVVTLSGDSALADPGDIPLDACPPPVVVPGGAAGAGGAADESTSAGAGGLSTGIGGIANDAGGDGQLAVGGATGGEIGGTAGLGGAPDQADGGTEGRVAQGGGLPSQGESGGGTEQGGAPGSDDLSGAAGAPDAVGGPSRTSSSCGCRAVGGDNSGYPWLFMSLVLGLALGRRSSERRGPFRAARVRSAH